MLFDGEDITEDGDFAVARRGIIRTFQKANVFDRLTVVENLLVGAPAWEGERLSRALGPRAWWRDGETERVERAYAVLRRFELERLANEYAGSLSGGQKRLVELMRALMASPGCCSSTSRWPASTRPWRCRSPSISRTLRDEGITMLMVEHELRWVEQLCDPIVVMAHGQRSRRGLDGGAAGERAGR